MVYTYKPNQANTHTHIYNNNNNNNNNTQSWLKSLDE